MHTRQGVAADPHVQSTSNLPSFVLRTPESVSYHSSEICAYQVVIDRCIPEDQRDIL